MARFNSRWGTATDHLTQLEQAKGYLQGAVDSAEIGQYRTALSEALGSLVLFAEVQKVVPAKWIWDRANEASLVMDIASAHSYTSGRFPRYVLAHRSARRALRTARELPDGYQGIGASKKVYTGFLTHLVDSTRRAMGVREERHREIETRKGILIKPPEEGYDSDDMFTEDEWNDVVDAYVELDMATRRGKNRERIEKLKLEIADMTAKLC